MEIGAVAAALYLLLALPALSFFGWSFSADLMTEASDFSVAFGLVGIAVVLLHAYAALRLGIPIVIRGIKK